MRTPGCTPEREKAGQRIEPGYAHKMDLIGFGALNVDLIYKVPDDAFNEIEAGSEMSGTSTEGKRALELVRNFGQFRAQSGGGSAANTAFALSRMGFRTGFIGKTGTDSDGQFLLDSLGEVDRGGIRRGGRTGISIILLGDGGERTCILFPNCNDTFSYDEVDPDYAANTRIIHITSFLGSTPFNAQMRLIQNLPDDVRLTFDPGMPYVNRGLEQILTFLSRSWVVFLTKAEVELLTGQRYEEGCRSILDFGPELVICKLGSMGSHIFSRDEEFEIPAQEADVVDTTGAGDVFAAGFLAGLLLGWPLRDCTSLASRAAAVSVTGYGRQRYPEALYELTP